MRRLLAANSKPACRPSGARSSLPAWQGRPLRGRKRPVASIPVGAISDGDALRVGHGRGAFQRIVGNIEGEKIGFGLIADVTFMTHIPSKVSPARLAIPCH